MIDMGASVLFPCLWSVVNWRPTFAKKKHENTVQTAVGRDFPPYPPLLKQEDPNKRESPKWQWSQLRGPETDEAH